MIEIDGSQKSGSGTILRLSIALAGILGEPLHIFNIRQKRHQPGLSPQHLESVKTASILCNANTKGVKLGSREFWFEPHKINGGLVRANIGTAGSIPMLLMTILPLCINSVNKTTIHVINGGTDVWYSPTINYFKYVFLSILSQMGLKTSLKVKKYGYFPKGMGEAILTVNPVYKLNPISINQFGKVNEINGISVCTNLKNKRVAERQAKSANNLLGDHNYEANIQVINDESNLFQKGSSIVLWARTSKNALIGSDALGKPNKLSETVGKEATENLLKEIEPQATVDVHLSDMLIPYIALAKGTSTYLTRKITEHLETNIWLVEKILNIKIIVNKIGNLYRIEKN